MNYHSHKPITQILTILNNDRLDLRTIDPCSLFQAGISHRINGQVSLALAGYSESQNILSIFDKLRLEKRFLAKQQAMIACTLKNVAGQHQKPILFLKGIVLSQMLYRSISTRESADIDILVRESDVIWFDQILQAHGYFSCHIKKFSKKYERSILNFLSEMTYYHPKKKIKIDLHWKLDNAAFTTINFNTLLESDNLQWIKLEEKELLPTLPEPLNFLYICSHAEKHFGSRLHWLYDTLRYATIYDCDNWNYLIDQSKEYGIDQQLYYLIERWKLFFPKKSESIQTPVVKKIPWYFSATQANTSLEDSSNIIKMLQKKWSEFQLVQGKKNKVRYLFQFVNARQMPWITKYQLPVFFVYLGFFTYLGVYFFKIFFSIFAKAIYFIFKSIFK